MMTTEKRLKPPMISSSKGSSLIIQLPTTSATNETSSGSGSSFGAAFLEHQNIDNEERQLRTQNNNGQILEQNNMFNNCLRNNLSGHASRPYQDDQSAQNGFGASTGVQMGNTSSHQQQRLYRHRYHLNNFHNHIDQGRRTSTGSENDEQQSITPPPHYHEIPGVVPAYQGRSSGPPPAYDDVINPNAPPPSYQSLFGQVREARKSSNGLVDLFRQLFLVLIGTIGCTMIIGFLLLIPITMILVGLVYIHDCRAENIPSFLVVGGSVWIVKNVLNCYNQFKKDSLSSNRPPPRRQTLGQTQSSATAQNSSSSATSVLIVSSPPDSSSSPSTSDSQSSATPFSLINSHSHPHPQALSESPQNQLNSFLNETSIHPATATTTTTVTTITTDTPITTATTPTTTRRSITSISSTQHTNLHHTPNHIRHPPMIGLTSFKCESILNYFLIVWFLAGCIVVYRIYEPDYENPASANYCNRSVYLYAFWLMTSAFIVMAIILSCLCCLMASSLMSCSHGR